jgi:hypothetical protein
MKSDPAKGRLEDAPKFTYGGLINLGIVPEPRPIAKGLPQTLPKIVIGMRLRDSE